MGRLALGLAGLLPRDRAALLRGRIFDENDKPVWAEPRRTGAARRVVISERLAKRIFPNVDPVGKHVILWKGQGNMDAEVVGVVGDSRERGLASNSSLTVYLPYGTNALPASSWSTRAAIRWR